MENEALKELTFFPLPAKFRDPGLAKGIPYNLEAERACVGSVLINNNLYNLVFSKLKVQDFFDERNRSIIEMMGNIRSESGLAPLDIVTLASKLNDAKMLHKIGGHDYLNFLSLSIPTTVNIEHYIKIVKEKSILRQIISICDSGSESSKENTPPEGIIERVQQNLYDLLSNDYKEYRSITEGLNNAVDTLNRIAKGEESMDMPTHFIDLDRIIGGFQPSNLIILGGRTGMGKTAFALSLILRIAGSDRSRQKPPGIGFFSLEMSEREICSRLISSTSNHTLSELKKKNFAEQHWDDLIDATDQLRKMQIFIDDTPGIQIGELRLKARRMVQNEGVKLIVIDYLQLLSSAETNAPREQQISNISKQLKTLARELDIPIITLTQLNRSADYREDKVPRLSDIRESGAIEQDADLVMFLHRPSYDKQKHSSEPEKDHGFQDKDDIVNQPTEDPFSDNTLGEKEARVYISKNRHGPTGMVRLEFDPQYMRFSDYYPL